MGNDNVVSLAASAAVSDPLADLLRAGARRLIEAAVSAEFGEYLSAFEEEKLPDGRRRMVRNGHLPERRILTGIGAVDVRVPKARSRSGSAEPFRSALVPPYVRRSASVDAAVPWLSLHGVSTGQMRPAVAALVGEEAARGLSANVVSRLKRVWDEEYREWCRRDLADDWVYVWADGIHSGLRGDDGRLCVLVVIGVNARGDHGRDFTPGEMALLRALIAGPPALNRHALSKEFCRRVGWFKPDGGLKDMMARVTMLAMHKDGLITLPPPKWRQNRPGPIVFGPDTEPPPFPAPTTLDEVRPLDLRTVVRGTRAGKLWNEFVARHHYLGHTTLVGAQMRYAVHDRDGGPIAMLGSAPPSGSSPRATTSSDGRRNCARRTSRWWSTIRGSSSCPGSKSPTSARTSSPSSAAACPRTGPSVATQSRC